MINTSQFEEINNAGFMNYLDEIISSISVTEISSSINSKNPFSGNYDSYGADMSMTFDTSKVTKHQILIPLVISIINRFHYLDSLYINELITAKVYNEHKLNSKLAFEKLFIYRIKSIKDENDS